MVKTRILVVDDEEGMLEVCFDTLHRLPNTEIVLDANSKHAAERLATETVDLLIADVRMPHVDGLELLRAARRGDPNMPALMITAYPTIQTAVESMKLGAADYVVKPFEPENLLSAVKQLLEHRRLRVENQFLRRHIERTYAFGALLGNSVVMQRVLEKISRVASTDLDVLICGETGTGKELVARAIHQGSRRKDGAFVPVDCGAIPNELMESEFFGHERGAYTGALARNLGLLEFANQGTFFLDEIAQLPLRLQAKLLRVLQERRIRRVGGTEEIDLDVRILAATSVELEEEVRKQRFRLDLYHRVHVACIELPPLRERGEDIPLLVNHFLKVYAGQMEKEPIELSPEVMEVLTNYSWPGNVRELQNVLKRTLALANRRSVGLEDLPDDIIARSGDQQQRSGSGFFELREQRLIAFEKEYFRNLLTVFRGEVSHAAREARLPRGTVYRLLKKHEINPAQFRAAALESGNDEGHVAPGGAI